MSLVFNLNQRGTSDHPKDTPFPSHRAVNASIPKEIKLPNDTDASSSCLVRPKDIRIDRVLFVFHKTSNSQSMRLHFDSMRTLDIIATCAIQEYGQALLNTSQIGHFHVMQPGNETFDLIPSEVAVKISSEIRMILVSRINAFNYAVIPMYFQ
jgi:hypothetical protein